MNPRPAMNHRIGQRGFALLIVLWTLAILSLIGADLVATSRQETRLARNMLDAAAAEAAADGAVQQAIFALLAPPPRHWRPDGRVRVLREGPNLIELRIEDEGGKVNVNFAPVELLQSLLLQLGSDPQTAANVAAAIDDWRTTRPQPVAPAATLVRNVAAGRDYAPPGAPFESLDELAGVLGMTPAWLALLRPHVTLYSDADPDGSSTDPVVAAAVRELGRVAAARRNTGDGRQVALVTVVVRGPRHVGFSEQVVVRTNALDDIRRHEILSREILQMPRAMSAALPRPHAALPSALD
jgi:general secretion pathway protein K